MKTIECFESPQNLINEITKHGYIANINLVLAIYLAYHLQKPLLLEGQAGTGKTEIANIVSKILNDSEPIRLQCYEGLDDSKAIYEWDYKKQLLFIEANKNDNDWDNMHNNIYSEKFLSPRPILKSIISEKKEVLLIDEVDKSDEEFEPLLLEILSAFQVSIPEIGTIKSKNKPLVILTSNNIRELSDALKRRCLYFYIDYPTLEQEIEIVQSRVSGIDNLIVTQIVSFVQMLREENLKKAPSISETIDWAITLIKLNANAKSLNLNFIQNTLNVLLKTKQDIEFIDDNINKFIGKLPKKAVKIDNDKTYHYKIEELENLLSNENSWDF